MATKTSSTFSSLPKVDPALKRQQSASLQDLAFSISLINAGSALQISNIMQGAELQAQGSLFTAQGLRQSKSLLSQTTNFNLSVDANNTIRKLKSLSADYRLLTGRQIAQQAATGLDVGSKSFAITREEAQQTQLQALLQTKIDAENVRRAKVFESDIQLTNLENQAKAAEYQANVSRILGQQKAREVQFGANAQIQTLMRNFNRSGGSLINY